MEGNWIIAGFNLLSIILLVSFFTEGNIQDKYIGCYHDPKNQSSLEIRSLQDNANLTIELCIERCRLLNSTYAALQSSEACLCGNKFGVSSLDTSCNLPCPGNQSQYCGGSSGHTAFYSVYAVCEFGYYGFICDQVCHCRRQAPCKRLTGECSNGCDDKWLGETCNTTSLSAKYIGCFRDKETRAFGEKPHYNDDQMTVEFCSDKCISMNGSFAGLQYMSHCFCGETYARYGQIIDSNCNETCKANSSQFCGGAWANSVYSVCPAGYYGPKCHEQCNCYNGSRCVFSTGECNSTCEAGWSGTSCNIQVCPTDGGDCLQNETCSTIDLNFATLTRCLCSPGFKRNTFWDICEDVDECEPGLCDVSTTECNNTVGSYKCICQSGYENFNGTSCFDMDECELGLCDVSTTECNNTVGSYKCICQPGYENFNGTSCFDIDECSREKCDTISMVCSNTVGSFQCNCKRGFQTNESSLFCTDIDECNHLNVCDIATSNCTNAIGGFTCNCLDGYQEHNDTFCTKNIIEKLSNAGPIVGAVTGSVLGVIPIVVIVFLVLHFYRRKVTKDSNVFRMADEETSSTSMSNLLHTGKRRVQSLYGGEYNSIPVSKALNTIRRKLSDPEKLQKEFEAVPQKSKDFSALGTREEMKQKNRFINIIPYDWNRVVLSRTTDDDTSGYINASYIQGYNDVDKFIATQGPRVETVEDFWRMIHEKDIRLIVMITNLVENQRVICEKYWPNTGQPVVYGDITVALKSEDSWPNYTVRQIQATKKSQTVTVTQWHYMAWPDHGVPTDAKGFLDFRRKIRQHMLPEKFTLVHCSAGAGRTGTFIAIDYLLEQEKVEFDVDILGCLKQLRDQRSAMIQNLKQYEFVHTALLIAFTIGDTAIPVERFLATCQFWQETKPHSEKSTLEIQFETMEDTKNDPDETARHRVWSNAVQKKKIADVDAVFVQGWKQKDAYISMKLPECPNDFWNLCREQRSSTIIFIDAAQSSDYQFLPTNAKPIALNESMLYLDSETREDYGSMCIVTECRNCDELYANTAAQSTDIYLNVDSNIDRTQFTILHVTESLMKRSGNADPLFSLYNALHSPKSEKTLAPVILVTRTDCSLNGFCLAAFNVFDMIKHEKEVDVYQTVLNIRKSKTDLFDSMSSFVELHDLVGRYIRMSRA